MKPQPRSPRRGALVRALALVAATGAVACADADETIDSEERAQQTAPSLDAGVVADVTRADAGTATGDASVGDAGARLPVLTKVRTVEGLASPESVFYDDASASWYVSNVGVNRQPGDGFISKLDAKGALVTRELVKGLDDPKGLRVHDGVLYVTDNTKIVRFPVADPSAVTRIAVPSAVFLNDLTVDPESGDVYASDSFGSAIFALRGDTVSEVIRSPALEGPNGLAVKDGALFIAGLGQNINPATFATTAAGRVQRLDLTAPSADKLTAVTERLGFLDGLEPLGDGWLASNYQVGVFYVDAQGKATKVQDNKTDGLSAAADIGVSTSQKLVAIPDGTSTKVVFYSLGD